MTSENFTKSDDGFAFIISGAHFQQPKHKDSLKFIAVIKTHSSDNVFAKKWQQHISFPKLTATS
jgi:hypothetical protein